MYRIYSDCYQPENTPRYNLNCLVRFPDVLRSRHWSDTGYLFVTRVPFECTEGGEKCSLSVNFNQHGRTHRFGTVDMSVTNDPKMGCYLPRYGHLPSDMPYWAPMSEHPGRRLLKCTRSRTADANLCFASSWRRINPPSYMLSGFPLPPLRLRY